MATVFNHVVPGDLPEYRRTFRCGKLENSPYEGYWFVNFGTSTFYESGPDYTFVLREASPVYLMEHLGADPEKWKEQSLHSWEGDWCEVYETLWQDIPFWVHTFPNGNKARYGMSHTPHLDDPKKYLWYITLGEGVVPGLLGTSR